MSIYIAVSQNNLKENIYKVGKTINLDKRLSSYNVGRTDDESYYYVKIFNVSNNDDLDGIEYEIHKALNYFRHQNKREIYKCSIDIISSIIEYIIKNSKEYMLHYFESQLEQEKLVKQVKLEKTVINDYDIMRYDPSFLERFGFSGNNIIYYCNKETNIWGKTCDMMICNLLEQNLIDYGNLNRKEMSYIKSFKNQTKLKNLFIEEILEKDIGNKLDENLNIFATKEGLYDTELNDFRQTRVNDYVLTNCGWKYNKYDSIKYMSDVINFFNKLFPIEQERNTVLTFISSLLNGKRIHKKFLALVDERKYNTGKSTLTNLLRTFFGDYFQFNNIFYKNKIDIKYLKGKRLLIIDGLKNKIRLCEELSNTLTEGRRIIEENTLSKFNNYKFTLQTSKFTLQTGLIIIFDKINTPNFNSMNRKFKERLLLVPMRSEFTNDIKEDDYSTFTFRGGLLDDDDFDKWNSSMFDLLLNYRDKKLNNVLILDSLCECKNDNKILN